jgi:hypothetical protein
MTTTTAFLLGAIAMGSLVVALFFLRFWRETQDPLFATFGGAFALEVVNRSLLAFQVDASEGQTTIYLIRLAAYSLLIVGIVAKNLKR